MPHIVYFPTGVAANQGALSALAGRGGVVLTGAGAHVATLEKGGLERSGVSAIQLKGEGMFTDESVLSELERLRNVARSRNPPVVAIENSHMVSGGRVWDWGSLRDVVDISKVAGAQVYLDGARLFDAAAATGVSPAQLLTGVDAAMVSLSKGLGAPDGAVIAFRDAALAERLEEERITRGGGSHQSAAMMAAAALVGIEESLPAIPDSHRLAQALVDGLGAIPGIELPKGFGGTNIVLFRPREEVGTPKDLLSHMREEGVMSAGVKLLRLFTHPQTTQEDVDRALEVVRGGADKLSQRP